MASRKKRQQAKVGKVLGEFKAGKLRSGSKTGPKVTKRKQAIAIALNESGQSKPRRKGSQSVESFERKYGNKPLSEL